MHGYVTFSIILTNQYNGQVFDKNKMQNKKGELDESTDKFSKLEGCSTFFKESALDLFYIIYYNVSRYSDYRLIQTWLILITQFRSLAT